MTKVNHVFDSIDLWATELNTILTHYMNERVYNSHKTFITDKGKFKVCVDIS